ncbi:MAG TPA: ERCC4 domain-containing protein [Agriterribacter sp.]|nr:ERCC4 domain-containing protein [Agriterribacter sp.]
MLISIQADHREHRSGIPQLLTQSAGVSLLVAALPAGDYIINGTIGIERKTAEDFVRSIICNRLFDQIGRLKRSVPRTLLIVEGNPYATAHEMHPHAIRGALLSVLISWQTPAIFSKSAEDTVAILLTIARQDMILSSQIAAPQNRRPKKTASRQLLFLQGIPGVGPALAARLLAQFGNLKAVINATEGALKSVEGIGENSAKKILGFIGAQFQLTLCNAKKLKDL